MQRLWKSLLLMSATSAGSVSVSRLCLCVCVPSVSVVAGSVTLSVVI
jgi:hypothetical protein